MDGVQLRQDTIRRRLSVVSRRILPQRQFKFLRLVFQSNRFSWWWLSSYFPRQVRSKFVTRTPQVYGFGASHPSFGLAKTIQSVNVMAPTKMCRVMTKFGSDKGRPNNYTPVYSSLLKQWSGQPIRIFELGLGTNNTDVPSNMGVFGLPGASHRGWRELFPHASVYGADIDRRILFQEDRIKTFYCDQLDPTSIEQLWAHQELQSGMDIIIEDGLHTFEGNVSFLNRALGHLRPGGIYITEDIAWSHVPDWCALLETTYSKQYPTYEFALVVLAEHGYNNLLVARRGA